MSLRAAALVLAYNQEEYLAHCLEALRREVEQVVVVHSDAPFTAYNPAARRQFTKADGTAQILASARSAWPGIHLVQGRWDAEEPMRDAGLERMRELGVELCYIVDADEFYHEGSLERIQRLAGDAPSRDRVYWARGRHLFRGFDYLVSGGPAQLLPVALHVAPGSKFINCRVPSGVREDLPHDLFYWHTGYVGTDQRMWEKVNTFGHAHELAPGWFEEKWKAWTPETTDLCRKRPERWPRTEQIDPRRLPAVLRSHRFHAMALQCRIPR